MEQLTGRGRTGGRSIPINVPAAGAAQKMTLRRFMRVTIDNFRQLIQSIASPTTTLPMPVLHTPPHDGNEQRQATGDMLGSGTLGDDTLDDETLDVAALVPDPVDKNSAAEHTADDEVVDDEAVDDEAGNSEAGAAPPDNLSADDAPNPSAVAAAEAVEAASADEPLSLHAALESLLFVADEAAEPAQLARALGVAAEEVAAALQALADHYCQARRGLRLQVRNGRYQLVTAPEAAGLIEIFLNLDTSAKLSAPALEALAVVAYRQPVTRAQIEAVRGVDCSGVLRSLLQRGLLEEVGRLDAPGRPVLYGITDLFMHHFGLTTLQELPPLASSEMARIEEIGA